MKTNTVLSEYSKLLLTIYRKAQDLPVHEFQDGILSTIKTCLPFDSAMWGTARVTPAGIDVHSLHLHNTTQAMVDAYEKVKHLGPAAMLVTEKPTATIAFNAREDFPQEELREYREFLHEHRHENFFITSEINPITRFAHWVSLYRFDKDQRCTPEETELLSCLAPHLMQALAINRLVHLDRLTGDVAREKWAVALADSRGVLYHADKRFRELVRMEWAVDGGGRLPQSLLDGLTVADNQITGEHVVIRRSLERGLLFLKARPREAVDELSAREFLVARLLAGGLTRKQVAAKLQRSPETISSQVKTIFEKLGINNVAMLGPLLVLRE
jgi:DNA-binding CsgD family transcriptional regulator